LHRTIPVPAQVSRKQTQRRHR